MYCCMLVGQGLWHASRGSGRSLIIEPEEGTLAAASGCGMPNCEGKVRIVACQCGRVSGMPAGEWEVSDMPAGRVVGL